MSTESVSAIASLDNLDRRIIGALQVDGRASWARIAAVLDAPERTVARRGIRLLQQRLVAIAALPNRGKIAGAVPSILAAHCRPATVRIAATGIAQRPETLFCYITTGEVDCTAELWCKSERLSTLLLDELPSTPGIDRLDSYPITRYFRTAHDWQPGVLTAEESAAMSEGQPRTDLLLGDPQVRLTPDEYAILRALIEDGRRTNEELARLTGVSDATAARKLQSLRERQLVFFRAVVEPALLGLPVEAMLWVSAPVQRVEEIGATLQRSTEVRYAAAIAGRHQIVANLAVPSLADLHNLVTSASWVSHANAVEMSLVISSLKRSTILTQSDRQRSEIVL